MMKNKIKKFLATAMIISTVATPIATMPVQAAQNFSDVPSNAWYKFAVDYAVDQGITSGTGDGKFSPSAPVTRGQMITFLWRDADSPVWGRCGRDFDDVKPDWTADGQIGNYCYYPVSWGIDKYITAGTGNNKFSPNKMCTRAQIVTMMYRAAGAPEIVHHLDHDTVGYKDVDYNQYYADAIDWAEYYGVVSGIGNRKFGPNQPCTRAQAVTLIRRFDKIFDISTINTQDRSDVLNRINAQNAETEKKSKPEFKYTKYTDLSTMYKNWNLILGDMFNSSEDSNGFVKGNWSIVQNKGTSAEVDHNVTVAISPKCTVTFYKGTGSGWKEYSYKFEDYACNNSLAPYYTTAGGAKRTVIRIWAADPRSTLGKNAYVSYDKNGVITHFYDGEWS